MSYDNSSKVDIDIFAIFNQFKKNITLIFGLTIFTTLVSVIYSLTIPDTYKSTITFTLAGNEGQGVFQPTSSSSMSALASLSASIVGQSSTGNSIVAVEKLKSKDFILSLNEDPRFASLLLGIQGFNSKKNQTIFKKGLVDPSSEAWLEKSSDYFTTRLLRAYKSKITVYDDNKSGLISVSSESLSPVAAYELVNMISKKINESSRSESLLEADSAIEYLTAQLAITQQTEIRKVISNIIQSQLNVRMLANIREEHYLKTFDSAYVPEIKSSPNRMNIALVGFFSGLFLSLIISVFLYYRTLIRNV